MRALDGGLGRGHRFFATSDERDSKALSREPQREGLAQARTYANDDCYLGCYRHEWAPFLFDVIGWLPG